MHFKNKIHYTDDLNKSNLQSSEILKRKPSHDDINIQRKRNKLYYPSSLTLKNNFNSFLSNPKEFIINTSNSLFDYLSKSITQLPTQFFNIGSKSDRKITSTPRNRTNTSKNNRNLKHSFQSPFKKQNNQQQKNLFYSQMSTNNSPSQAIDVDDIFSTNNTNNNENRSSNNDISFYTPKSKQSFIDLYKNNQESLELKNNIDNLIEITQNKLNFTEDYPPTTEPLNNQEDTEDVEYYSNNSFRGSFRGSYSGSFNNSINKSIYSPTNTLNNSYISPKKMNQSLSSSISSTNTPTSYLYTSNNRSFDEEQPLSIDELITSNNYKSYNQIEQTSTLSLMSSFRPKPIEILETSDNERFYEKVTKSKKESRDEDINSLLEKLQTISQTHSWSVIKQLESRIEQQKKQKPVIKPLTDQEEQQVRAIFRERDDKLLAEIKSITVYKRDIIKLQPGGWLNDEIINFYMELLMKRQEENKGRFVNCHFFSSFFYQFLCNNNNTYSYQRVKKWTKDFDIFSKEKVIIPVHMGNHWCCAVINFTEKRFEYYDSLLGDNYTCLKKLRDYIRDEMNDKSKKGIVNLDEFTDYIPKDIPVQHNGYDCGVFTCKFADYLSRGISLLFSQKDIPLVRKIMILECVNKKLFV